MSVAATTRAWESDASGNDLLVLLALADHAGGEEDPYDFAYPAVARLERMTRLSRRTVQRALRSLEADRYIKITGEHRWGKGKTTIQYRIEGGRQSDAAAPDVPGGASPVTPNPSGDPSTPSSSSGVRELERPRYEGVALAIVEDAEALLKVKKKVDGRMVTPEEMARAAAALDEFNRQAEADFGLGAHLVPLVMRLRERPSMDASKVRRLVQSAWRIKWWERNGKGRRATPAVVFGNAGCFENVVQDAVQEAKGETPNGGPAEPDDPYTRND